MTSTSVAPPTLPRDVQAAPAVVSRRPLATVCIPTRNRAAFLRDALVSVLGQDIDDLEILVLDDASWDETGLVVREFADPRIIHRRHDRRVGIAENRNACLDGATGRYLAWLDDDDAYTPGGLRRQLEVLETEPDVVLVHGAVEVVDGRGMPRPAWSAPFRQDTVEPGADAFSELVLSNYVRAPTAVTRADAHRRAGPYATNLGDRAEDWDAWLRVSLRGDVAFSARPVARYRCHAGGASARRASSLSWLASETLVVRRALKRARGQVPGIDEIERRADAALTARHLEAAGDALARGFPDLACRIVLRAGRVTASRRDALGGAADRAAAADEHGFHEAARPVLRTAAARLTGTRFGEALRARLEATDDWSDERAGVAGRIRRVVPAGESVAAIDKWDPSLLHEAQRTGWHFPDLALSPDGYPADDDGAIDHLEAQRSRGARYLVVPRASFWWLDHYGRFSAHLDRRYDRVLADELCIIYRLAPAAETTP
ncbi:MAG: glycosyltransferase [Gemmatimonadota bacterium]|nr:glycosyltransferase [Gemmatimonadota bacterium]